MYNNPAIGVMGGGAWGTTVAKLLSDKNSNVLLCYRIVSREADFIISYHYT